MPPHASKALLAAAALLALLPAPAAASHPPDAPDGTPTVTEWCIADDANQARAEAGRDRLWFSPAGHGFARDHAVAMAESWEDGEGISHSDSGARQAALPDGTWAHGEVVAYVIDGDGWQPDCSDTLAAFLGSSFHRRILLDTTWTHVTVGVHRRGGYLFVAVVLFANDGYGYRGIDHTDAVPDDSVLPYWDDDTSSFEADIAWLHSADITSGCHRWLFCPDDEVTRGQMAAFLVRALDLTERLDDPFSDDDGSTFEADIERLAAAGITTGCEPGRFCPDQLVTRGQMAAFLVRAFDLPPAPSAGFVDTAGHLFEDAIDSLAAAGITTGCGSGRFCPSAPVTRGQMAAFLHRAITG